MASTICGQERQRQVVGHVLEDEQLGAGDELGRALAAREGDERVDGAVDHEGRDVELREAIRRGSRTP